jgi:pyruvate-ferredoxin/flavodoxin oxidoreductase
MKMGFEQQKKAVASGAWVLYRYDPRLADERKNPLQLDYRPHKREATPPGDIAEYMYNEVRFKTLLKSKPERAAMLLELAKQDAQARWTYYKKLAEMDYSVAD